MSRKPATNMSNTAACKSPLIHWPLYERLSRLGGDGTDGFIAPSQATRVQARYSSSRCRRLLGTAVDGSTNAPCANLLTILSVQRCTPPSGPLRFASRHSDRLVALCVAISGRRDDVVAPEGAPVRVCCAERYAPRAVAARDRRHGRAKVAHSISTSIACLRALPWLPGAGC